MPDRLVVGLDVGGTTTRAVVVSLAGERVGAGRAGGGNPTSHGAERAADQLRTALQAALAGINSGQVLAGVIGLAGAGRLAADPAGRAAFDRAWAEAGLRCPYQVHGDALVAYASATAAPDGTVLIAGTGAIAAQISGGRLDRIADGHGWLLGDAGSGFWLGREAVRGTLAELDSGQTPGPLSRAVLTELLGSAQVADRPRQTVDQLVQAVTRRPPVELARLAPLVLDGYQLGPDPACAAIVSRAAELLAGSAARVRQPDDATPVVLGGGLLAGGSPLAGPVRAALRSQWTDAALVSAGDGAAGAAWLAARTLPGVDAEAAARLHDRLLG